MLTSELFGLESTIDPVIDEKFYNYYQLLANSTESSNDLSATERNKKLKELKHQLQRYNTVGFTRRNQMVYDLIDECLAKKDRRQSRTHQRMVRDETKRRVFGLWDLAISEIKQTHEIAVDISASLLPYWV